MKCTLYSVVVYVVLCSLDNLRRCQDYSISDTSVQSCDEGNAVRETVTVSLKQRRTYNVLSSVQVNLFCTSVGIFCGVNISIPFFYSDIRIVK